MDPPTSTVPPSDEDTATRIRNFTVLLDALLDMEVGLRIQYTGLKEHAQFSGSDCQYMLDHVMDSQLDLINGLCATRAQLRVMAPPEDTPPAPRLMGVEPNPGPGWTTHPHVEAYGFPSYQVSTNGEVYDTNNHTTLSHYTHAFGYPYVRLKKETELGAYRWVTITIARLLALSFGILENENLEVALLDGDPSNFDLINLAPMTRQRGSFNCVKHSTINGQPTASLFIGVTLERGRWRARARLNRQKTSLGYYDSERAAAQAYNDFVKATRGEYACLNNLDIPGEVIRPVPAPRLVGVELNPGPSSDDTYSPYIIESDEKVLIRELKEVKIAYDHEVKNLVFYNESYGKGPHIRRLYSDSLVLSRELTKKYVILSTAIRRRLDELNSKHPCDPRGLTITPTPKEMPVAVDVGVNTKSIADQQADAEVEFLENHHR